MIVWPTVNKKWCGLILRIATFKSTQHGIQCGQCLISLYHFAAGKITNLPFSKYDFIQFLTSENCFVIVLSWLPAFDSNILPSDRYAFSVSLRLSIQSTTWWEQQANIVPSVRHGKERVMRFYIFNIGFSWYTVFGQRSSENKNSDEKEETFCEELLLAKLLRVRI